jgi:hypothetical protein
MSTRPTATYTLTVHAGPAIPDVTITAMFYDEDGRILRTYQNEWSAFCWTWQDLILWLEKRYVESGGTLNVSLNRPSPFVDLS